MGTCGGCGAGNREGARFCASCGGALTEPCPSCGAAPARPDARFCDRCGSPLASDTSAGLARKVVTVLFADLVGSTAAQEAMDPESVRRWLDRYYAVVRSEVEAHGGRIVKFIGDGIMAVFGVPDVREDDADRAIAAAQQMHAAVAELAGDLGAGTGVGLRVGVNTGEVVVSATDDDVVGDVVNVAARLEQAARPGEVLVGEATFRLVRTRARLRAVPPLDLKGKSEPVPAFLLQSLSEGSAEGQASPFVGRAGELERLLALLDAAISEQRVQLASVVGSPGVGKSRLVHELAVAAGDRARAVVVRCDPSGGATFGPVASALRAAASLEDDASDETIVAGLSALFDESEPERQRIAATAASILGVGEPGLPEEVFWAVRRLIEHAARRRPLLFVFEDVHWAEPLLLDLVENVAAFARGVPAVVVVTARPELREQRPSLVEVGGQLTAAIHLEGLAVDESRRLTRALLDGAALPSALLDRVASASEGNPLFVRELVRMLVDDGVLRQADGSWTASVDVRTIEVPLSIHAVLAARIDRLAPGEQEVLGAAAVLGRTFARGGLLHLVGSDTAAQLDEHLEGLRRKELVERAGTYWLDEPQLRFHHALVQDAAYRRLLKEDRAHLHERAAEWLSGKVGDQAEHDDLIGFQLEQAHQLRVETGLADAAVGRAAAERLRSAGRRALDADDRPGAAALLGRALGCLEAGDATRGDLLIERCEALLAMGDVTEAAPVVVELVAASAGDDRLGAWAACFEGEVANLRDPAHLGETIERAAAAATTLEALGDPAGVAKAHAVRAASLSRLGRMGECERALDQALAAARTAGDRRRATAILAGAPVAALWGPNPVTRASGRCLDVVRVLRITSRAPAVEATSLRCQAVLEALRGRTDAARRMLASARAELEELGHVLGLVELDLAQGMVETFAEDPEAASASLERALIGFHELGIDTDAALAAALLARIRRHQGALDAALALTRDSERLGGDDLRTAITWRAVRAAILASQGEVAEARRLAEEAVALAEPTDALIDHGYAVLSLADVLAAAGDSGGAAAAAREALELFERKEATVLVARARTFLGEPVDADGTPGGQPEDAGAAAPSGGNAATRLYHQVLELALAGDAEALAALASPDIVYTDHRPLVGGVRYESFERVHEWTQTLTGFGFGLAAQEILAIRGDRLALLRIVRRAESAEIEALVLTEIDERGLGKALDIFEVDQLDAAMAILEERAAAIEAPTPDRALRARERRALRQTEIGTAALARGDRDAVHPLSNAASRAYDRVFDPFRQGEAVDLADVLRPDVVYVDHRPVLGGPRADNLDQLRPWLESLGAIGFERVQNTVVAVRGDSHALVRSLRHAGDSEVELLVLLEADDAGLGARADAYDPSQIDEALRQMEDRWDELQRAGAPGLENDAVRRFLRGRQLLLSERYEEYAETLAEDIVVVDHRPMVGGYRIEGRAAQVGSVRTVMELGTQDIRDKVLALRGEHLALLHTEYAGQGYVAELLTLLEYDGSGRVSQGAVYDLDQLDEAVRDLDQRYAAQLDPASAWTFRFQMDAFGELDRGELDAVRLRLAPDYRHEVHAPASFGSLTTDEWLGSLAEVRPQVQDLRWFVSDVMAACPRALLYRVELRGELEGGPFATPYVVVAEIADRLGLRSDLYDPAQEPDARARYAQLAAEAGA